MVVEPFRARVPESVLADLRHRLRHTREVEGGTTVTPEGFDTGALRELLRYWADGFDWRSAEDRLNQFSQFKAEVGGLGVHFIHERGRGPRRLPLVITHGWPGSVLEMLELIPRLTDPARFGGRAEDAFDLVVPSLPGYGFSQRPTTPGMHPGRIAELWLELMSGLGYERFGAQGGDWGASVATRLALLAPERLAGLHLNYLPGSYRPPMVGEPALTEAEVRFLDQCASWAETEGAYAHVQRTRPDTLAVALTDSPAGLAAWMVEKLWGWSDQSRGPQGGLSPDDVLANVTLYWVTGTIGSSMRLYREASRHPLHFASGERVRVPTGLALFPAESPANPPREWVERGYAVTRWSELSRGHFAAWEQPDLLAAEIREFFRPLRDQAGPLSGGRAWRGRRA